MNKISFKPVWFDSMGAKSSATLIKTPDVSVLIDPGAAGMQPSFPASDEQKQRWHEEAYRAIRRASKEAQVVVISHYHYDHFTDFEKPLYAGKLVLAKDPNQWINDSQMGRSEKFYGNLCRAFEGRSLDEFMRDPEQKSYPDPMDELPVAREKDFGDYNSRRQELLQKGRKWFEGRAKKWNTKKIIPELDLKGVRVRWIDGKAFQFGKTKLRFTNPLFHGIEFSRVGWVCPIVIECEKEKFIHSSDLNGPIIEDYAEWIIREDPNVLVLDGPMTYLLGFTLNLINLKRTIENASRIVSSVNSELIIYDHHLPRDRRFRERTKPVWSIAERERKKLLTAAEYLGKEPVILTL
ncbi:MAG TPA: MBL fold metallo-hydrolase [Thermoplasmata archaeon]|nr:MBL fold metallo-hydrolase [Thermoplasmata archaeon]